MRPRKTRFAEAPWSLVNPCWLLVNESVVVDPENPGPHFFKILQNIRDTILLMNMPCDPDQWGTSKQVA